MDFTVIPRNIKKMLADEGCPLSEEQYLLAAGALAAYQLMIVENGFNKTIDMLEAMSNA